jgi:RNA polymerase sigma factor (sigma-70 family)
MTLAGGAGHGSRPRITRPRSDTLQSAAGAHAPGAALSTAGGHDEAVDAYLRDIGRIPLLTQDAERACFRQIEASQRDLQRVLAAVSAVVQHLVSLAAEAKRGARPIEDFVLGQRQARVTEPEARYVFYACDCLRRMLTRLGARLTTPQSLRTPLAEILVRLPLRTSVLEDLVGIVRAVARSGASPNGHPPRQAEDLHVVAAQIFELDRTLREARAAVTEANLRLVVAVARRYAGFGVPLMDLIQEGNIGLMTATERFQHRRGHRFSTYAIWWIRRNITNAFGEQGRTIRLPPHVVTAMHRVRRVERELERRLGHPPSIDELADACGLARRRVRLFLEARRPPVSLAQPLSDDVTMGDLLADGRSSEDEQLAAELATALDRALALLSPRERAVVRMLFGLDGDPQSLETIGRQLKLSRERVRTVRTIALRKLNGAPGARLLRAFCHL